MQVLIQQQLEHVVQHATTTDGALEMYPGAGVANIGIMFFRSSAMIFAQVCNCPSEAMCTPDRSDMTGSTPCGSSPGPHLFLLTWHSCQTWYICTNYLAGDGGCYSPPFPSSSKMPACSNAAVLRCKVCGLNSLLIDAT